MSEAISVRRQVNVQKAALYAVVVNAMEIAFSASFALYVLLVDVRLENPRTFLPGNKMSFAGLPDAADRRDLIAWLQVNTTPGQ